MSSSKSSARKRTYSVRFYRVPAGRHLVSRWLEILNYLTVSTVVLPPPTSEDLGGVANLSRVGCVCTLTS